MRGNLNHHIVLTEKDLICRTIFNKFSESFRFISPRNRVYLYKVIEDVEGSLNPNTVCFFTVLSNLTFINSILNGIDNYRDIYGVEKMFVLNPNRTASLKPQYTERIKTSPALIQVIEELYFLTSELNTLKLRGDRWINRGFIYNKFIGKSFALYEDIAKEMKHLLQE